MRMAQPKVSNSIGASGENKRPPESFAAVIIQGAFELRGARSLPYYKLIVTQKSAGVKIIMFLGIFYFDAGFR